MVWYTDRYKIPYTGFASQFENEPTVAASSPWRLANISNKERSDLERAKAQVNRQFHVRLTGRSWSKAFGGGTRIDI